MDFEDRVRSALKQDAQNIQISWNVRKRIVERLGKQSGRRKWLVGIGVTGILLLGVNFAVSTAMGESLFSVVVHWTSISRGGGFMTGYSLIPTTSSTGVASQNAKPQPAISVGKQPGAISNTTSPARAIPITGPTVDGNSFMDIHDYGKKLTDFLGTEHFPKLNMGSVLVNFILAIWVDKDKQKFDLDVQASISGTQKESIRLMLYHNQEGTIQFDGGTTSRDKQDVKVNGQNATYINFSNGDSEQRYITWKQGAWIIVLSGSDLPEATLMKIAQNVDLQAQENT
jgi:hypothetical protein